VELTSYSAPPDSLAGFKGAASRRGLIPWEGKRAREEKGRMGKGGEKREVGGIAPWLLRGIDAPRQVRDFRPWRARTKCHQVIATKTVNQKWHCGRQNLKHLYLWNYDR